MSDGKLKATVKREMQESWYYIDRIEKPGLWGRVMDDEPTKVYIKELTPKQLETFNKILSKEEKKTYLKNIEPVILRFQKLPEDLKEGNLIPKKAYKNLQQNYSQLEDKNKQKLATV